MSTCTTFKFLGRNNKKRSLEILLNKLINVQHTIKATYTDENDNISKETFRMMFVMNKKLSVNEDLSTVLGKIIIFDGSDNENSLWIAVYDEHTEKYNITGNIGNKTFNFIFGNKTKLLKLNISKTIETGMRNESSAKISGVGSSVITPKKCKNAAECINVEVRKNDCESIISNKKWGNCIEKSREACITGNGLTSVYTFNDVDCAYKDTDNLYIYDSDGSN